MFIALGLSKAAQFQERFESVLLASVPRANNATGKGRLAQEQLLSSTYSLVVEIKWKELNIHRFLLFLNEELGKQVETYKSYWSFTGIWHFLHYFILIYFYFM